MDKHSLPADPMSRFREIYEALNSERSWFRNSAPLRFAAMTAITCPGTGRSIATSIRRVAEELQARQGWGGTLASPLRFIVGAMLLLQRDTARGFLTEVERVRAMFRDAGIRRGSTYETMAILVMRIQSGLRPIGPGAVARFRSIYEEMKKHHWWLTGPDDFPACAILAGQDATPAAIGERVERIYQALCREGFKAGDPLQTAANLLYLARGSANDLARRYRALALGFKKAGVSIWQSDYDELAILSFLEHAPGRVVDLVVTRRAEMAQLHPRPDGLMTFNLASSVAFLELVQRDANMRAITDAKALMDMQAVVQAQQAAAISAATSASVVAATSGN